MMALGNTKTFPTIIMECKEKLNLSANRTYIAILKKAYNKTKLMAGHIFLFG